MADGITREPRPHQADAERAAGSHASTSRRGPRPGNQRPHLVWPRLQMLFAEPAPSYHEISARLGMKTGSIGPTRLRCLSELRQTPALIRLAEQRRYDSGDVRHAG